MPASDVMKGAYVTVANIIEITTVAQWHQLIETSMAMPVVLLKHSTTCPISGSAWKRFEKFVQSQSNESARYAYVKVIEARPVSNLIAEETRVKHESPQVLILRGGKVVWTASHWAITEPALETAMSSV